MVYNEIGKTGMTVSNLGFGASSLGGVFRSIREDEGIRAVHVAIDNGINLFHIHNSFLLPFYNYRNRFRSLPDLVPCLPRGYCCITLYQPGS